VLEEVGEAGNVRRVVKRADLHRRHRGVVDAASRQGVQAEGKAGRGAGESGGGGRGDAGGKVGSTEPHGGSGHGMVRPGPAASGDQREREPCKWDPREWEPCKWDPREWEPCKWDPRRIRSAYGCNRHCRAAGWRTCTSSAALPETAALLEMRSTCTARATERCVHFGGATTAGKL
jgi:hypothetical protein